MRRSSLAVAVAALAALSCGKRAAAPPPPGAPAAERAAPLVPEGFEPGPDEVTVEYDPGRGGRPALRRVVRRDAAGKEILLRKEKDLNGDGMTDVWERYGPDGRLTRAVYDLDFDGRPDEAADFEAGALVERELQLRGAGVPSTRSRYAGGRLVARERDTNGDGRVDTWEEWRDGELLRIGIDRDGDGRVDRWAPPGDAGPAPRR